MPNIGSRSEGMRILPKRTREKLKKNSNAAWSPSSRKPSVTLDPDLFADKPLIKPVTMSLFGHDELGLICGFREGGPISRADYARLGDLRLPW